MPYVPNFAQAALRSTLTANGRLHRRAFGRRCFAVLGSLGLPAGAILAFELSDLGLVLLLAASALWAAWAAAAIACASTQRLHDSGRSGWWQAVPFAGLLLLCAKGDAGVNRYGAPGPRGPV